MSASRSLPALLLLASGLANAQALDYGSFEELFGEPVTTSVTGSPQRTSAAPATIEIITAEQIRRSGAVSLPGILRQVSGIDVLQWTASHSDVAVRGYNKAFSSRLLVLVNGRQIYADHYGYTPWAALPVELGEIRQVEIVKGPNSALFGFNAVGGVINIVTYSPLHDDVDFVTVRAGSQDHREVSAAATLRAAGRLGVRLSGGLRESDDFNTPLSLLNTGVRGGDERKSARLDLHYQATDMLQLELEATSTNLLQTAMSPSYSMAYEDKRIQSIKGNAYADTRLGLTQFQAYRNWIENDVYAGTFNFETMSVGLTQQPVARFDNELSVVSLQHIFRPAPAHTVRVGGEYRESRLPTTPFEGAVVSYDVLAASGMWEWRMADALTLTLAARRDDLQLGRRGPMPAALPLTNADWDVELGTTSLNAALMWQVDERNVLRLNAARGAQLPSLFNLGGSLIEIVLPPEAPPPTTLFVMGLPTVRPTTVDAVELGWEHAFSAAPYTMHVAAFKGRSRGVIADSGDVGPAASIVSAPANIGNSSTRGVEFALNGRRKTGLGWALGYLYQQIDDDFGDRPDWLTYANYEDTTPRHLLSGSVHWTRGDWEADAYLSYKSDFGGLRLDEDFVFNPMDPTVVPEAFTPLDSVVTMDLHLGYRFNERLRFDLQATNLLDSPQTQTSGPRVERRVFGSLRLDF
ncbi:MAG TPA: TonB-dependent receptor [Steroidobacteraceae bacterium]|nr:TonB-dependent receptor [Steroidobacteraceae bacterium]